MDTEKSRKMISLLFYHLEIVPEGLMHSLTKAIVRQACFNLVNWMNAIKMDSKYSCFLSALYVPRHWIQTCRDKASSKEVAAHTHALTHHL